MQTGLKVIALLARSTTGNGAFRNLTIALDTMLELDTSACRNNAGASTAVLSYLDELSEELEGVADKIDEIITDLTWATEIAKSGRGNSSAMKTAVLSLGAASSMLEHINQRLSGLPSLQ